MSSGEAMSASGDHAAAMDAIYRTQRHAYDLTRKYYLLAATGYRRPYAASRR
jgi:S-adenosylmethionine-diacylgycerolhomoserine-N-methlytransferase